MQGRYLITFKKIFPMMYFTPQSKIIWPLFQKDLWLGIKISIWLNLSFDHNSCISGLNEQCEGTLNIYRLRIVQWYHGHPIWCLLAFSTKILNIQDSYTNATPKVKVHLGVIGLNLLHCPSLTRMCFIFKHILLASCALAFYT